MTFSRSVATRMAKDIKAVRRRLLRKMKPDESYFLMRLADDLEEMAQLVRLETLANKFERGQHHIGTHLDIDDPLQAQEIANEMATDLRDLRRMALDSDSHREPITQQRLLEAEALVARYGEALTFFDTAKSPQDISLN